MRPVFSEFIGTASLLIIVVGSGIMGEDLSQGNVALALLANSIATGAGLYAIIQAFGPISGAHFNPAVSFFEWRMGHISTREMPKYILAQITGAVAGVWITHAMFGKEIFQMSRHARSELRFMLSEFVATLGLLLIISLTGKQNPRVTPSAVALYITSAYWCTSSTSFANPAVTIARSLTDTFAGIQWGGAPGFILAQLTGALTAFWLSGVLTRRGV